LETNPRAIEKPGRQSRKMGFKETEGARGWGKLKNLRKAEEQEEVSPGVKSLD